MFEHYNMVAKYCVVVAQMFEHYNIVAKFCVVVAQIGFRRFTFFTPTKISPRFFLSQVYINQCLKLVNSSSL